MVTCMDGKDGLPGVTYGLPDSIPQIAPTCAARVGLPWAPIAECAAGARGRELLKAAHFRTMALFEGRGGYEPVPAGRCGGSCTWPSHPLGHGYRPPLIPNVWIEQLGGRHGFVEYNDVLRAAADPYADLVSRVCDAYTGVKPPSCR